MRWFGGLHIPRILRDPCGDLPFSEDTRLFFFQPEAGIRYLTVTGVQTCALPISATELGERCDPPAAPDAAGKDDVGLDHVDAAAQDEVARLVRAAHHLSGCEAQARQTPQR